MPWNCLPYSFGWCEQERSGMRQLILRGNYEERHPKSMILQPIVSVSAFRHHKKPAQHKWNAWFSFRPCWCLLVWCKSMWWSCTEGCKTIQVSTQNLGVATWRTLETINLHVWGIVFGQMRCEIRKSYGEILIFKLQGTYPMGSIQKPCII